MKIVCPIDYSEHSNKALTVSVMLSNILNAELDVIHVISGFDKIDYDLEAEEKKLAKVLTGIGPLIQTDLVPRFDILHGTIQDEILEFNKHNHIDLVVMGTKGASNLFNVLFGSQTEYILANSIVPVLSIPLDFSPEHLNNDLVLALDKQEIKSEKTIELLLKLARALDKKIDILHIQKPASKEFPFDPFIFSFLKEDAGKTILIEENNIINTIAEYGEQNHLSLIAMIRRNKSLFQELTQGHKTTIESLISKTPILILPEKN